MLDSFKNCSQKPHFKKKTHTHTHTHKPNKNGKKQINLFLKNKWKDSTFFLFIFYHRKVPQLT